MSAEKALEAIAVEMGKAVNAEWQRDAIETAVREVHQPIDALNTRYNQVQQVCTGCGTDSGNWAKWPCRTIQAIERAKRETRMP